MSLEPVSDSTQLISGLSASDHSSITVVHGQNVNIGRGESELHLASKPSKSDKPFSAVPFAPDPDFVDRVEISAWIRDKCAQQGARAALVGLGGIGSVNIPSPELTSLR